MRRISIRLIAPALLALPVLVVAGVLIAIGVIQGRASVDRLASQQLAQIHDQIGQHVSSLVILPTKVTRINIALIENGLLDTDRPRTWRPNLIEQFSAFGALSSIVWGGEDGRSTWVARYGGDDESVYYTILDEHTDEVMFEFRVGHDGRVEDEPVRTYAFDPRIRPWYTSARDAGVPTWSEPYLWIGGDDLEQATLGIAYGWPHKKDGRLVGVVNADLSLQDISRYLSGLQIGRTGRAYLVDHGGMLLASSTGAAVADASGERLRADASEQAWISASTRRLEKTFASVGAVDRDHEERLTINGGREWLFASPFTHESGLRWVIVTVVPESDFMAEIAAGRRRSAWFAIGAVLVTLGLGALLASALVRPILNLSRHMRLLGEGELDREISLPYARELSNLSDDINCMAGDLRDRMALRRSLALAMEVQQSLLPSTTPVVKGLDIAGHSTYCDETGGDYYDYLDIADLTGNTAALVVGDVVGHGIAAAMLMATARGILRSRCADGGSLGELLKHLNTLLVEVTGGERFMTMVIVTINADNGELRLSSAGHDPPFVYDPAADQFIELDAGGLPLGIMEHEEYPEASYGPLPPGSIILASTDGVWESWNEAGEQFKKERVRTVLRENAHLSAGGIAEALRDALRSFCGEARQLDDITFVVAKRL